MAVWCSNAGARQEINRGRLTQRDSACSNRVHVQCRDEGSQASDDSIYLML